MSFSKQPPIVNEEPPPFCEAAPPPSQGPPLSVTATTGALPPSYNEAVDPNANAPISYTYEKPTLAPGVQPGSYIPNGQYMIVMPHLVGLEWRWVPQTFTDPHQAKMEAIARLSRVAQFRIVEMIQWLQTVTRDCIQEPNTYVIHDGTSGTPLFVAKETSDGCARCCLAPNHAYQISIYLADHYGFPQYAAGALYTIDRDGADCNGCGKCTPCPLCPCAFRKALCCFNCGDCARNETLLYEGAAPGYPKETKEARLLGRAKEGSCCSEGWCLRPSISLYNGDSQDPYAIAEGPALFGGLLNCCVSSDVPVSYIEDLNRHRKSCQGALDKGDLAMMRKLRPDSFCGMLRECCTDADIYSIDVNDPTASIETRVSMMASLFMIDSMLFERDMKPVEYNGSAIIVTLWECFCCGVVCPCCVAIPTNNG